MRETAVGKQPDRVGGSALNPDPLKPCSVAPYRVRLLMRLPTWARELGASLALRQAPTEAGAEQDFRCTRALSVLIRTLRANGTWGNSTPGKRIIVFFPGPCRAHLHEDGEVRAVATHPSRKCRPTPVTLRSCSCPLGSWNGLWEAS